MYTQESFNIYVATVALASALRHSLLLDMYENFEKKALPGSSNPANLAAVLWTAESQISWAWALWVLNPALHLPISQDLPLLSLSSSPLETAYFHFHFLLSICKVS